MVSALVGFLRSVDRRLGDELRTFDGKLGELKLGNVQELNRLGHELRNTLAERVALGHRIDLLTEQVDQKSTTVDHAALSARAEMVLELANKTMADHDGRMRALEKKL